MLCFHNQEQGHAPIDQMREACLLQQTTVSKERPQDANRFSKRVGSTIYRVNVHFSRTSKETANDKIIRLIKNESAAGKEMNP